MSCHTLFETTGKVRYGDNFRCVVEFTNSLGAYYRALMPKSWICYGTRYTTHLTVVRTGIEIPKNLKAWKKYEGRRIRVKYEHFVLVEPIYYVLRAWSEDVEEIRLELGLPRYRKHQWHHITIGHHTEKEKKND